ncbi:hypothetical protein FACS1894187_20670 [Synergistales bacterium]|nr:hypothetical protein FACS1894187_20670 [Synergistales bacterium]
MKKAILVVLLLTGIFVFAGIGEAAMSVEEFCKLCEMGTPNEVEAAIRDGADVNARYDDITPLMRAATYNSNPEVTALLLENGVDINAEDADGLTALMLAAYNNSNPEVIALLLKNGANPNVRDSDGKRAIDHAGRNEKLRGTAVFKQLQEASKVKIKR